MPPNLRSLHCNLWLITAVFAGHPVKTDAGQPRRWVSESVNIGSLSTMSTFRAHRCPTRCRLSVALVRAAQAPFQHDSTSSGGSAMALSATMPQSVDTILVGFIPASLSGGIAWWRNNEPAALTLSLQAPSRRMPEQVRLAVLYVV
jgi:hypothetical protein